MSAPAGCYTTARVVRGKIRHLERHIARLLRDARGLGLGALDPDTVRRVLTDGATRTFADSEGVIRLEVRAADGADAPHLVVTTRGIGDEPDRWRTVLAREPHPGRSPWSAFKTNERASYERALAGARATGADEALLADAEGRLVEGARTNVIVVDAEGILRTPPLTRGAQAGIARAILLDRIAELVEADVAVADLAAAREIVLVNAVRGAKPACEVDGRPVADGRPGPWRARLAAALDAD